MKENSGEKLKQITNRINIANILLLGLFLFSAVYLFMLQVMDIKNYRQKALNQRSGRNFVMRGQILDRLGLRLAADKTSYNIYAHS